MYLSRTIQKFFEPLLDEQICINQLRSLEIEWNCAVQFIWNLVSHVEDAPLTLSDPLKEALANYQHMCRDGIPDRIRLLHILDYLYQSLKDKNKLPSQELTSDWCKKAGIPLNISEHLIHV